MDAYRILGVTPYMTKDEAKKVYRKLAMQSHPDRGGNVNKFHEIQTAWEKLDKLGDQAFGMKKLGVTHVSLFEYSLI